MSLLTSSCLLCTAAEASGSHLSEELILLQALSRNIDETPLTTMSKIKFEIPRTKWTVITVQRRKEWILDPTRVPVWFHELLWMRRRWNHSDFFGTGGLFPKHHSGSHVAIIWNNYCTYPLKNFSEDQEPCFETVVGVRGITLTGWTLSPAARSSSY